MRDKTRPGSQRSLMSPGSEPARTQPREKTATQTIAEQVAAMNGAAAAQPPKPVASVFAAEQARLAAMPVPDSVLKPGTMVAETGLLDPCGQPTTLYAALAGRPAVLVSCRGGWCPDFHNALAAYQAQLPPEPPPPGLRPVAASPPDPPEP